MTALRGLHRYDVNISLLFAELPILERPAAAAAAGFEAIEVWWPFPGPEPADREVDAFVTAIRDAGVALASLNFDAGDMATGSRGLVTADQERFRRNVPVTVGIAEQLGCRVLNALFGNRPARMPWDEQRELGLEQLAFAAEAAASVGATVVVEALNPFGAPKYPILSTRAAAELATAASQRCGHQIMLCYDIFHMQQAEGNLVHTMREYADHIAHVQIADVPGRGEPGTGEIAFPRVLKELSGLGYSGYVGLEYQPTGQTVESFGWLDGAIVEGSASGQLKENPRD